MAHEFEIWAGNVLNFFLWGRSSYKIILIKERVYTLETYVRNHNMRHISISTSFRQISQNTRNNFFKYQHPSKGFHFICVLLQHSVYM